MTTVAVIGGIGCGKSTVTSLLAARGAAIVDADVVAREVAAPGSVAVDRLAAAFGEEVVTPDGALDRAALARIAFATPAATARMNEILHPAIGEELLRQVTEARAAHDVVAVAIPLFRREHRALLSLDLVVLVECSPTRALDRLEARGLAREDASLRMAAQGEPGDRRALADVVIENDGTVEELAAKVDALWGQLHA